MEVVRFQPSLPSGQYLSIIPYNPNRQRVSAPTSPYSGGSRNLPPVLSVGAAPFYPTGAGSSTSAWVATAGGPPPPPPATFADIAATFGPGQQVQPAMTASGLIDPCNLFCKNLDSEMTSSDLFGESSPFR